MSADAPGSVRTFAETVAGKLHLWAEPENADALTSPGSEAIPAAADAFAAVVAEALSEAHSDEAATERLLVLIRDAMHADCVALWLRNATELYCTAEAGMRTGVPRGDLIDRACEEQRPVGERERPDEAALVIPVRFRGEVLGAIEITGSAETCSGAALKAVLPVAHVCADFLARIGAFAGEEDARRLLAAVLEELDEGVLVVDGYGARCSNRRMTELLGALQPDGTALQARLEALLGTVPDEGALDDHVVIAHAGGATTVAIHAARLPAAGGCAVIVASPAGASPGSDEAGTKRLEALSSFTVGQGHDVARLARAIAEQLLAIESGPAREALSQTGQLEALVAARTSAAGVLAIGDDLTQIQESAGVILVVDDEDVARRTLTRMLERAGYRVYTAADATEALRLAERYAGLIDLVVSDLVLPMMSGRRLLHALADWQPQARHLLISGRTTRNVVHLGRNGRPVPFLAKPFSYDVLNATVAALVQQRPTYRPKWS